METKKQEAIRLAYGEYWDRVKDFVDENGWLTSHEISPYDLLLSWNYIDVREYAKYHATFRTKSLSGLENNRGWISIESEEDLPIEKISYEVWRNGSESRATYAGKDRWFVPYNDFPKTTKVAGITHYAEPIKRQPPIF